MACCSLDLLPGCSLELTPLELAPAAGCSLELAPAGGCSLELAPAAGCSLELAPAAGCSLELTPDDDECWSSTAESC